MAASEATNDSSQPVLEMAEVVAAGNLKVTGDAPAIYQNLTHSNAVAHQQAMNQVQLQGLQMHQAINGAITGKITEMIMHTSPSEAGGDLAAMAQLLKGVQLTPPAV